MLILVLGLDLELIDSIGLVEYYEGRPDHECLHVLQLEVLGLRLLELAEAVDDEVIGLFAELMLVQFLLGEAVGSDLVLFRYFTSAFASLIKNDVDHIIAS